MRSDFGKQVLLFLLAFLARLPFLFAGYGVEEDSWGHVLHAALLTETAIYEVSRLPGHPLYEGLLLVLWHVHSPLVYNFFSALAAAGATSAFYRIAVLHHVRLPLFWAMVFTFVPIVFISGTYTIDYALALFFCLLAYESAVENVPERAGVWLAVAAGFRITSLGFILPIAWLLLRDKSEDKSLALRMRKVAKLSFSALPLTALFYVPPYLTYGSNFFDFHKPPYPALLEAFYKMSVGVWGLVGVLAITAAGTFIYLNRQKMVRDYLNSVWLLIAFVFAIAYFRMPEKAAFWLPVVPFALFFLGRNLTQKQGFVVGSALLLSGWVLGINSSDAYTGSKPTNVALHFSVGPEKLFLDPLQGPICNDYTKRLTKDEACRAIEKKLLAITQPTYVIAGWWYAMLEVRNREALWKNPRVTLSYMPTPAVQESFKNNGYTLLYLPQQAEIVDRKYNTNYTVTNATLLPLP